MLHKLNQADLNSLVHDLNHQSIKITIAAFGFNVQITCYLKSLPNRNILEADLESEFFLNIHSLGESFKQSAPQAHLCPEMEIHGLHGCSQTH